MVNAIKSNPDYLHGFKIKLYPTETQKARIKEISDLFRYIFNKTVSILFCNYHMITEEEYMKFRSQGYNDRNIHFLLKGKKKGSFLSFVDMCKIIAKFRNENDWLKAIPINIARYAMRNVYNGYKKFFKGVTTSIPYMKKKYYKDTFSCRGERVYFRNNSVKIEGIDTEIYCGNVPIPKSGKYYSCTITHSNDGEYWLSLQTEIYSPIQFLPREGPIGIDVGMRKLVTLSDGTIYKPLDTKRLEKRRRKKESKVAKDRKLRLKQSREAKTKLENIPMSKRMQKRYQSFRKLTTHIWNKRNTYVHQITREIVNRRPSTIVIEDITVMNLMDKFKKQHAHVDLRNYLFREIRRQIEYKSRWEGIPVIVADKFYPSSQICSNCGNRQKIGKKEIYKCPVCGLEIDRDINAAINLRNLAI